MKLAYQSFDSLGVDNHPLNINQSGTVISAIHDLAFMVLEIEDHLVVVTHLAYLFISNYLKNLLEP